MGGHVSFGNDRGSKKNLLIAIEVVRNADYFNCKKCSRKNCDEARAQPLADEIIIAGETIKSHVCFRPMISAESYYWLSLHKHYQKGLLFCAGGLADQPAVYADAMELIEAV